MNEETNLTSEPVKEKRFRQVFKSFVPKRGYVTTPILVYINIFVFFLMLIKGAHPIMPETETLISWGANFRPKTTNGEWWRLFTSCFLHIGVFHLIVNMFSLIYIGLLLESKLGSIKFLIAYVVSGLIASSFSVYWFEFMTSAGASGAIFGMFGTYFVLLLSGIIDKENRKNLLPSIGGIIALNIVTGFQEGIDYAAHIGGLISGITLGIGFYPLIKLEKLDEKRVIGFSSILIILLASSVILLAKIPKSKLQYFNDSYYYQSIEKELEEFYVMETMALEVYNLLEYDLDNERVKHEIETRSLYYWRENLKLIKKLDKYHLPDILHKQNKILIEYCQTHIKLLKTILKSFEEESGKYDSIIDSYVNQIEVLQKQLQEIK
jgi:rhomboid protease GluP